MRVLTIPALILAGFLVIFFLVDVLRARYRLRQQLYMPLRHVQQLLTVEVRRHPQPRAPSARPARNLRDRRAKAVGGRRCPAGRSGRVAN